MIKIVNNSTDPYFNMALEEYIVKQMDDSQNYFMLWQNQPAVIVGRNQNTIEEINQSYIKEHGIIVMRRLSGGGAVYHDHGNLNFTFVLNDNKDFANFEKFTRPVINALGRLGIVAENNSRNDISIDGRKFSGNAQFKYKNRLLHHGTILFNSNIEAMVQALNPSGAKISSKGIKSVRSRVTNICEHLSVPVSIEEFKQVLTEEVLREEPNSVSYHLNQADQQAINQLRNDKYATWAWVYGTSPPYNLRKTGTFAWGNVDIRLDIKQGIISSCRIYGDYFATGDISELERELTGTLHREDDISQRLSIIGLQRYLPQCSDNEFIDLLCK
jgi:lipoate-protein ligase A